MVAMILKGCNTIQYNTIQYNDTKGMQYTIIQTSTQTSVQTSIASFTRIFFLIQEVIFHALTSAKYETQQKYLTNDFISYLSHTVTPASILATAHSNQKNTY